MVLIMFVNRYSQKKGVNFFKFDSKKSIHFLINVILIFIMVVPTLSTLPMFATSPNDSNNITNNKNVIKNNLDASNQVSNLNAQSNSKNLQPSQSEMTASSTNNQNSNQNLRMQTSNFKTISGVPSSNVKVNETADLTQTNSGLSTANSYVSSANMTSYTYTKPSGYANTSNTFDISSITATTGVYTIYYASSPSFLISSQDKVNTLRTIASSFQIANQKENITEFRIYLSITSFSSPKLNVSLTGALSNSPDFSTIYASTLLTSGGGWTTITFSKPVTLSKGNYYFTFNDTSTDGSYFSFYGASDTTTGNQSRVMRYADSLPWVNYPYDLAIQYKYLVLNDTDATLSHSYSSPQQVKMIYNGGSVSSLNNNYFNYNNATIQFTTNVSITFTTTLHVSISSSSNPLPTSISYTIVNNTFSNWNVSFTDNPFPSNSFTLSNRVFTVYSFSSKWNVTRVLENTTIFDQIPFGVLSYTNGSTSLAVNSGSDANKYTWTIEYQSSNYVSGISLQTASQNPVMYPYHVNSTDTLTVSASLLNSESGTNGTLAIYDYSGALIFSNKTVSGVSGSLSFSSVLLSSIINNNNPNGTYIVSVEWLDSATQTKLGYYERSVVIISSTSLVIPSSLPDTIGGTNVSVAVAYKNALNNTVVNGAKVLLNGSWTSTGVYLINTNAHDNYSGSINTTGALVGSNTITITASLTNYVTLVSSLQFNIVYNTSLTVTTNETSANFGDTIYFDIKYADLPGGNNISGATVTVNGISATPVGSYYTFTNNTSTLSDPSASSLTFTIVASKTNYLLRTNVTVIILLQTPTTFNISPFVGNTTTVNKQFAFNSADLLSYTFAYNDTAHNLLVSGATLSTNSSGSDFSVTGMGTGLDTSGNWAVTINPLKTGSYPVTFTFTKVGYKPVNYLIVFNILQSSTSLYSPVTGVTTWNASQVIWTNNSVYSNFIIYYGTKDEFTIYLTLTDSVYANQLITTSSLGGTSFSNSTGNYIVYSHQYSNGTYLLTINPTTQTTFNLNFTLTAYGYYYKSFGFTVVMQPIPTTPNSTAVINGNTYNGLTNNQQLNVTYQSGSSDNISLSFTLNDTYWNELVSYYSVSKSGLTASFNPINTSTTWYVYIDPTQAGSYQIVLTFTKTGYIQYILTLNILVKKATVQLVNPTSTLYSNFSITVDYDANALDTVGYTFIIQNSAYNSNITTYIQGTNWFATGTSPTTYSYALSSAYFYFTYNPATPGTYLFTYTFNPTTNYNGYVITVTVIVQTTPTQVINNSNSTYNPSISQNSIYFNGNMDQFSLSMHLIDANRSSLPSTVLLLTNGQLGISDPANQTSYFLYLTNNSASYWTITINPLQTGTFVITLTFSQAGYATTIITLTLIVKNNAFTMQYTNGTTWINGVSQSRYYNQGSKDNVTTYLTTKDFTYGVNATGANLSSSSNSNYTITLINLGNGMWSVFVNPLTTGIFNITILVTQTGYNSTTIFLLVTVNQTPTTAVYGTINYINATIPESHPLVNGTAYIQTFSQTSQDEFNFTFASNDSVYNELISSSLTYNASSYYIISATRLGSNMWNITLNPNNIGNFSVVFTLFHVGYSNITLVLSFTINKAKLIVNFINQNPTVTQNVYFASNYTILVNITSNFDLKTVNGVILASPNSTYIFLTQLPNGTYEIIYDRSRFYLSGTESNINVTMFNSNFDSNTTFWTFTINPPVNPLQTAISSSSNTYTAEWNNSITVVMNWYDPNTSFRLNTTSINILNNATSGIVITVVPNGNGQYTFTIIATNVGTFYVNITFTDPSLASYFKSSFYVITIISTKRSTATINPLNSNSDYTNNTVITLYYSRTTNINISWYDSITGFVTMSSVDISSTNWITYDMVSNNRLVFTVDGYLVGNKTVTLVLHSARYTDILVIIIINSKVLPTNTIDSKDPSTFSYYSGLYANSTNTSGLGYTLGVDLNWTIMDNNSQISNYQVAVYRDGTNYTSGITILSYNDGQWTSRLAFVFLPGTGYQKGWYNFTINLSKYGYVNQSISFSIYIKGFDLAISINAPNQLTKGSDYTITATVTYANTTITNTTYQALFKITGLSTLSQNTNANIGDPVPAGTNVTFIIDLTLKGKDGNPYTIVLNQTVQTNPQGVAFVTIPGNTTKDLIKVNSIKASITGSDISELSNQEIIPTINIQVVSPINPWLYIIPAIIVLLAFSIGAVTLRRRSKKATAKRRTLDGYNTRLNVIPSIYGMLFSAGSTGSAFYHKLNAAYIATTEGKQLQELISSLGTGIDIFLSQFQQEFMKNIQDVKPENAPQENMVSVSSFKKDKFHIIILNTQSYKGLVFFNSEVNSFVQNIFVNIFAEMQEKLVLDVLFDENDPLITKNVEDILSRHLPYLMLDKFVIDGNSLNELARSRQQAISSETIDALKRAFSILSFLSNPGDSATKQINAFNKRFKRLNNFGQTAGIIDDITSNPVLFNNLKDNIFKKNVKLDIKFITEALWTLPLQNNNVYRPYMPKTR